MLHQTFSFISDPQKEIIKELRHQFWSGLHTKLLHSMASEEYNTLLIQWFSLQPLVTMASKFLFLCSTLKKENHFLSSGTTQGWVNNGRIFIYGWTNPLISQLIIDTQIAGDKWSMNECEQMRLLKVWAVCVWGPSQPELSDIIKKKSFVYSGYLQGGKKLTHTNTKCVCWSVGNKRI